MMFNEQNRRSFMSVVARSLLGVGTWPLAGRAEQAGLTTHGARGSRAQSVIYLFMNGGMSHLDTFDTKPGAETQGPVASISTNVPGIAISEYFPKMAQQMDRVAIVNSLSSTQGAHEQGRYFMHTSYILRGTIAHPDLGAWSSVLLPRRNPELPGNVKIGENGGRSGEGFLESRHAALCIGDPELGLQDSRLPGYVTADRFQRRLARIRRMNDQFLRKYDQKNVRAVSNAYDAAVKLMKSDDLKAFDISVENESIRESYGDNSFGQGCLLARRLIEHRVRFVEVEFGGWDTHVDNFETVAENSSVLDQALSTLLRDLADRRLLDETLVVLATEFGRTPDIVVERDNGRNHYPKAFTCLLAGRNSRRHSLRKNGQRRARNCRESCERTRLQRDNRLRARPTPGQNDAFSIGTSVQSGR
jgi:hypothetical protein